MTNQAKAITTNPLSYAEPIEVEPEYIRLPRAHERDPLFSLSRGYLNLLILPCKANNYRPQVKSCVLRKRGAKTGVRLIDVESLRAYIRKSAELTGNSKPPLEPPQIGEQEVRCACKDAPADSRQLDFKFA